MIITCQCRHTIVIVGPRPQKKQGIEPDDNYI